MKQISVDLVGVVGAGTMGGGIARLFACHGYRVAIADRDETSLADGMARLFHQCDPAERRETALLVRPVASLAGLADCDLVIEAVTEDAAVKETLFAALDQVCRREAIIATNTSAISIDLLARSLADPARFIGMHFMNPPARMRLVEVVRGERTSPATVEAIVSLARGLDKVPVVVGDTPGFVANRLLFAFIGEALRLLESGAAGKEEIDAVAHHGLNHPMGPLALADYIGLDVCRQIMTHLWRTLGDDRYRPGPLLERLVAAGKLGRKSGEGFYRYDCKGPG